MAVLESQGDRSVTGPSIGDKSTPDRFAPSDMSHAVLLTLLSGLFFFAILTMWVPAYWPVSVFQTGVFVLALGTLLRPGRGLPPYGYPLMPLVFAVVWGLAQLLTNHTSYAFATRRAVVQWATFLAVYLIAATLFANRSARRRFRHAMLWFGFLLAVVATLQTFTSGGNVFWLFPSGYVDYVMGPILSRNHYAAFVEVVLPLALYQALRHEGSSLLYSGMSAAMYASVIASASRAGIVLTTAEIIVVVALMWVGRKSNSRGIGVVILQMLLLFGLFVAVVGWEKVWARIWQPDPMTVRREFNISSLHMISDHPWFGTGFGTWPTVYPKYAIVDIGAFANEAHDDWAQWTAEGGIPFGIVMGSLFLWSIGPAVCSIWGIGVIAVFLHAFVDYPFSRPALGCWPLLLIAMLAVRSTTVGPTER
jgi:O-antigen ligase